MQTMNDIPLPDPPGKQPLQTIRERYHISLEALSTLSGVPQMEISSCEKAACYFSTSLEKILRAINALANTELTIEDIFFEYLVPKELC